MNGTAAECDHTVSIGLIYRDPLVVILQNQTMRTHITHAAIGISPPSNHAKGEKM